MKQNPKYQQLAFPFADDWSLTKNGVENIKRMAKEVADDIDRKILNKLLCSNCHREHHWNERNVITA